MVFDDFTVNVLQNFSTINPSIILKEGNVIKTMAASKTLVGVATVPNDFEKNVAIHDLPRFLRTLSLFDSYDIDFKDNYMAIKAGSNSIKYVYSEESLITKAPEKDVKLPEKLVEFDLSQANLATIIKAMNTLGLPELAVVSDGKKVKIQTQDSKGVIQDTFSMELGKGDGKSFEVILKTENIKLLPQNYKVTVTKGIVHFQGDDHPIEYYVVSDAKSKYE